MPSMIAIVHSIYSKSVHAPDAHAGLMDNESERYCIKYQLYARDIKLLHSIKCQISNSIVRECLSCALSNSNTVIGYKLAFYRENFNISILEHDLKYTEVYS